LTGTALLVGMFLAGMENEGKVLLTQVTDTLYFEISPRMRERLDIPITSDTDHGFEAAYAVVRRRFHKLATACNPSPLPKNRRLDKTEAARLEADADPKTLTENRARLLRLTNSILEGSLIDARPLLEEHWDGSGCVDGTAIRAYSKGLRSKGPVTATDRTPPGTCAPATTPIRTNSRPQAEQGRTARLRRAAPNTNTPMRPRSSSPETLATTMLPSQTPRRSRRWYSASRSTSQVMTPGRTPSAL
jgi:hypothetical protein